MNILKLSLEVIHKDEMQSNAPHTMHVLCSNL